MSEYFIVANTPSQNISHDELSNLQKTGKLKVYGPYSADAMLKYYSEGKLKPNTVIYEKGAPFTQAFSDIYPSLKAGVVDLGTPPSFNSPPGPNLSQKLDGQTNPPQPTQPKPQNMKSRGGNYLVSSWRGEKGLAVAYWVNGFLFTFILQLVIGFYNSAASLFPHIARGHIKAYYAVALLFEVFAVAYAVWQTVGIWRSADNHKTNTGRRFFATIAQIVIVVTAIGTLAKIGNLGSYYKDVFWNALGKDPFGNYQISLSDDKETLKINGAISFGLASDVENILEDNPSIKTVVLNSDGGRIWAGENLYDVLSSYGIGTTSTETGCASACTIPFMAGTSRNIKDSENILGFHSSSSLYYMQNSVSAENARIKTFLTSHGVSSSFANKALSTPPYEMWYPEIRTLVEEGIVTDAYVEQKTYSKNSQSATLKNNTVTTYNDNNSTSQTSNKYGGVVSQTMNAAGYTYMLVTSGRDSVWIACPQVRVNVGDQVFYGDGMPMPNYYSKTLDRSFDIVYFVPSVSFSESRTGVAPSSQGSSNTKIEVSQEINLAGIRRSEVTVGEIFSNRLNLNGRVVSVRGKVIKFSQDVMGSNWIHLQDGTGADGANDLTVITNGTARVGDTVVVKGEVVANKDFGYGYFYDVIMDNAAIYKE